MRKSRGGVERKREGGRRRARKWKRIDDLGRKVEGRVRKKGRGRTRRKCVKGSDGNDESGMRGERERMKEGDEEE